MSTSGGATRDAVVPTTPRRGGSGRPRGRPPGKRGSSSESRSSAAFAETPSLMAVDDDDPDHHHHHHDATASLAAAADALQHLSAVATKELQAVSMVPPGPSLGQQPMTLAPPRPLPLHMLPQQPALSSQPLFVLPMLSPLGGAQLFRPLPSPSTLPPIMTPLPSPGPRTAASAVTAMPEIISTAVGAVDLLSLRRPSTSVTIDPSLGPPFVTDDFDDNDDSNSAESPGERRRVHNVSERRRRNSIKKGFADLKLCVPLSAREKHSKVDILNKAMKYMDHLLALQAHGAQEIARLQQELVQLKARVSASAHLEVAVPSWTIGAVPSTTAGTIGAGGTSPVSAVSILPDQAVPGRFSPTKSPGGTAATDESAAAAAGPRMRQ